MTMMSIFRAVQLRKLEGALPCARDADVHLFDWSRADAGAGGYEAGGDACASSASMTSQSCEHHKRMSYSPHPGD